MLITTKNKITLQLKRYMNNNNNNDCNASAANSKNLREIRKISFNKFKLSIFKMILHGIYSVFYTGLISMRLYLHNVISRDTENKQGTA